MTEKIKINIKNALKDTIYFTYKDLVKEIDYKIQTRTAEGNEFFGFLDLQRDGTKIIDTKDIIKTAKALKKDVQALVVVAPNSLALQSKAAIEFCFGKQNWGNAGDVEIIYIDHILSGREAASLSEYLRNKKFAINLISKSGNDIEVLANFKIVKDILEQQIGTRNANKFIIVTTNANSGRLNHLARKNDYKTFVILDSVSDSYSALTPVGLFVMTMAGIDIDKVLKGAKKAHEIFSFSELSQNAAYCYAIARFALQKHNINHELFVAYDEDLKSVAKLWQYLFGEADSKQKRSLYLDTAIFSKDISTRIQFIQEGFNNLFQTFLSIDKTNMDYRIPVGQDESEDIKSLSSLTTNSLKKQSYQSIIKTNHRIGKIRNIELIVEDQSFESFGHLIVFLQNASLMSSYLHGLSPFHNQSQGIYETQLLDEWKGR
ncbi:hypothetical protein [Mycoplasma sp. 3341]|uniref:hypothetical protein n=1 Tax=Mycoplasma sp. 3341 TaxID=3447506 RepID=UPI003F6589D2